MLAAAAMLRDRSLSAVELLAARMQRIAECNGGEPTFDGVPDAVNAFVRLYPELAERQAVAADERLAREAPARRCCAASRSPSRTSSPSRACP